MYALLAAGQAAISVAVGFFSIMPSSNIPREVTPRCITNVCTVFTATEIMNPFSKQNNGEDILAGVHQSIAGCSVSVMRRAGINEEVTLRGGVSRNKGMMKALTDRFGFAIDIDARFLNALRAALIAPDRAEARHDETQTIAANDVLDGEEAGDAKTV